MKICVLMGGVSSERAVSLASGSNIANALRENGHTVQVLDTILPWEQINCTIEPTPEHLENGERNLLQLLNAPEMRAFEFIFIALHGGSGENGILQGALAALGYKFNGSDHEGCAIAMDKIVSKIIFERYGIPTPTWHYFNLNPQMTEDHISQEILNSFKLPVVVKPAHEGSTVGISIVQQPSELLPAIAEARRHNHTILVEQYIAGREITVSILGERTLPLVEIRPKHGVYDYECKYTKGMSEYIVPAEIDEDITHQIENWSRIAFQALKCYGYGRFDLILDGENRPYFLELNSLPGMTATSLVPKAARAVGLSFNVLLEKIIELGLRRP